MGLIFTAFLIAIASYLFAILCKKPARFPPGPKRWPLIGSIPSLQPQPGDQTTFEAMDRLRMKFGNIVGMYLATHPLILLSGYEDIKKISQLDEFSYRPNFTISHHKKFGDKKLGLIFSDGGNWKTQRRFTLRHLRDFGFGKNTMENYIQEEVELLIAAMDKMIETDGGKASGLDVLPLLPLVAINILWYIISGKRHDLDDKEFVRLTKTVLRFFRVSELDSPVGLYKFLQHVPIVNKNFKAQQECGVELCDFVEGAIKEHLETFNEDHMRDFIDVFIKEMKEDKSSYFSENQLIAACVDLFLAGTETSSSTLSFILRYMLWYPEIQEKVRQEIFQIVGKDRLPGMEDIPNLPYCSAVMTESLRHSGVTPFTPPKSNLQDTSFNGYHIPKRSIIFINLRHVHMDPKHWGDPENFRPERFIGPDGKFHKDDRLMLFGTGLRLCLGEPFARSSAFLIFASLIQNYKFSIPENNIAPENVILPGITAAPKHFKMKVEKV